MNKDRLACGFGLLAQSAALDTSATKHSTYIKMRFDAQEYSAFGHTEDPAKSGFYASTGSARATLAGYAGTSPGEDLATFSTFGGAAPTGEASSERLVRSLMDSIYHNSVMFYTYRDVGLGFATTTLADGSYSAVLAWQPGLPKGTAPQVSSDLVVSYPCQGSTGLYPEFQNESPNPFAGVNMGTYTTLGHPLFFFAPGGGELLLTEATITEVGGGTVPAFVYTAKVDPQAFLKPSQVYLVPLQSLKANTSYAVNVRGTAAGAAFARAFTFATGKSPS